jgi:hypothetical protein
MTSPTRAQQLGLVLLLAMLAAYVVWRLTR